jgi:hypothetical protein
MYKWLKNPGNKEFDYLQHIYPKPLQLDAVGAIYSDESCDSFHIINLLSYWYVFEYIYNYGKSGMLTKCPFYDACSYPIKSENAQACLTGTWGLAKVTPSTCFIGKAWQQYGFSNPSIEVNIV